MRKNWSLKSGITTIQKTSAIFKKIKNQLILMMQTLKK